MYVYKYHRNPFSSMQLIILQQSECIIKMIINQTNKEKREFFYLKSQSIICIKILQHIILN